jgi:hypothetical protein
MTASMVSNLGSDLCLLMCLCSMLMLPSLSLSLLVVDVRHAGSSLYLSALMHDAGHISEPYACGRRESCLIPVKRVLPTPFDRTALPRVQCAPWFLPSLEPHHTFNTTLPSQLRKTASTAEAQRTQICLGTSLDPGRFAPLKVSLSQKQRHIPLLTHCSRCKAHYYRSLVSWASAAFGHEMETGRK